ncbi:putative late blight resistance proteinR1A-10 [Sesamum alatum]|uniref:Late blight resistance proteinR1A-10 n=1 Tax=Sesamum alatum TaxID=300844 RepID=A0AAE1YVA8_9LAMI|nr:putative late blight resistance proteinR1A-10 [Sesamum alatum]
MAAYGAVVSLQQILTTILDQPADGRQISFNRFQLQSLQEKVSFLLDFLEDSSSHKANNQSAQESLEIKIRDVAYAAEDVLESKIREKAYPVEDQSQIQDWADDDEDESQIQDAPNVVEDLTESQTPSELRDQDPLPGYWVVLLVIFVLVGGLIPAAIQKVMVILIQLILPVIKVRPFTLRALAPVCSQSMTFVVVQVLIPFTVKICWPLFILNFVAVLVQVMVHVSVLKGVSFVAPYVQLVETLVRTWFSRIQQVLPVKRKLDDQTGQASLSAKDDTEKEDQGQVSLSAKNDSEQEDQGQVSLSAKDDTEQEDQGQVSLSAKDDSEQEDRGQVSLSVKDDSEQEDQELLRLMEDIISITKEVIKIKDESGADDLGPMRNIPSAGSSSIGNYSIGSGKNVVVGFESDLQEMRTRLTGSSSKREVVSIVGMGGIGKTTLARQAYDDSYIVYHFDTRAWVAVSQEYSLRQVLVGLLDSAKILTENMYEKREEELADYLYKSLIGRRYLIVMDDIWDTEIWDAVRRYFPDDRNGSRILLTTRLSDVALYADSFSPLHKMQFLKEDESWNLLCKKVFGEKDCPRELEDIGKAIARNCGGLPLAIVVIGGLLSKERRQEYWRNLAGNLSSIVTKDDEQCLEILGLSYNRLPHRLRACFLYMAVFPEDYEIPVPKLIRLWAAEGFLKPDASKSLEDLAEEYLDDLIERNLILVSKRSANGKIRTCNIHDLLRNLCLRNSQKENFLYVVKYYDDVLQQDVNITPRRLSIHPHFLSIQSEILYNSEVHNSSAHSLLCTGARLIYPSRVYLGYRLLRVLDLIIVRFFHFPAEVTTLVNLRYLAFTYNEALPTSIARLQNLQTLVYHNWTFGKCPIFPVEIWMMPKLRHLCFTPCSMPVPQNVQMLVLGNLQTLTEVRNLRCSDDIRKRIPNLKELGISYDVSPAVEWSEYQLEALANLHQLETLKLVVKYSRPSVIVNPPMLAFPEKLKRLTLAGCGIPWSSMTIVGALPNLEVLKLRKNSCRGIEWEPVEWQFCQLKHLLLEEVDLVRWGANEAHFPRLQRLIIRSCYKLKEISSCIGEIPTLEMIELVDCHPSAVTCAEKIQEEQESMGNKELKVRIDLRRYFKNKFYSKIFH